jgi:hypothetical protein
MPSIVIENNPYPLPQQFSFEENDLLKAVAGISVGDLPRLWDQLFKNFQETGIAACDPALLLGLAAVAMKRAKPDYSAPQLKLLLKLRDTSAIQFDFTDEQEETDGPPAVAAGGEAADSTPPTKSEPSTTETPEPHGVPV